MRGWKKCFLTPPLDKLQNTGSLISLSLDRVDLSDPEFCLIKRG